MKFSGLYFSNEFCAFVFWWLRAKLLINTLYSDELFKS